MYSLLLDGDYCYYMSYLNIRKNSQHLCLPWTLIRSMYILTYLIIFMFIIFLCCRSIAQMTKLRPKRASHLCSVSSGSELHLAIKVLFYYNVYGVLQLGVMSVIFEDTKYSLKIANVRLIWVAWSIIVGWFPRQSLDSGSKEWCD